MSHLSYDLWPLTGSFGDITTNTYSVHTSHASIHTTTGKFSIAIFAIWSQDGAHHLPVATRPPIHTTPAPRWLRPLGDGVPDFVGSIG